MPRPLILVDPHPRRLGQIFSASTRARLEALGEVIVHEDGPMPDAMVEAHLPRARILIGQTALDAGRLARAARLRAVVNVETNFYDNLDYEACFARASMC